MRYCVLIIFIVLGSCKSLYYQQKAKIIYAVPMEFDKHSKLVLENKDFSIIVNRDEILGSITNIDEKQRLRKYIQDVDIANLPSTNLSVSNIEEQILINAVFILLAEGRVRLINLKNKKEIKQYNFLKLNDISGKQEIFQITSGETIFAKIISIGE